MCAHLFSHGKSTADSVFWQVGLMCEESKQPGDGAGLCPGYTISRAILTDAVCLTRGDRFLTTDLTREYFLSRRFILGFNHCFQLPILPPGVIRIALEIATMALWEETSASSCSAIYPSTIPRDRSMPSKSRTCHRRFETHVTAVSPSSRPRK
jgi:hypothetical protein